MNARRSLQSFFGLLIFLLGAVGLAGGCASESKSQLREKNAFLAGQNTVLMQQAQGEAASGPGVTIVGPVQHPQVPWVAGLTLAQAISTANYIGQDEPKQIVITRNGESATMDASALLNGTNIPLQIGDVIELR
jgi:hypothetical protein